MIYLDTHVVVWLYAAEVQLFPDPVIQLLENNDLFVSPIVKLELQFLKEINRITTDATLILSTLHSSINLQICSLSFDDVITTALTQSWTRNPFDRLIVGNAAVNNSMLVTKDTVIRRYYSKALWS